MRNRDPKSNLNATQLSACFYYIIYYWLRSFFYSLLNNKIYIYIYIFIKGMSLVAKLVFKATFENYLIESLTYEVAYKEM